MKKLNLQNIKKIFGSKIFIAIIFTLIGISGTVLAKTKDHKQHTELANNEFDWNIVQQHHQIFENDPFFQTNGIFAEVAEMEKQMNKMFANHQKNMQKLFHEAKESGKINSQSSVLKNEDEKTYYYELNFSGFKKEDIAIKIENNSLTFSAKKEDNKIDKDSEKKANSSFYYSFSLPKYNNKTEPEIIKEDNKITVKLQKN
ncbi:MAG: Hsp20/alpha crystallin family protein [Pelagibacterales bacterium]|nr:Hsp20/alpha crystallin family protein [Pelagibacterales bacterium]